MTLRQAKHRYVQAQRAHKAAPSAGTAAALERARADVIRLVTEGRA